MINCNHRQKNCLQCGPCPRCPACVCNGPKRRRGRPPKQPPPAKRIALQAAHEKLLLQQRNDRRIVAEDESANQAQSRKPLDLFNFLGLGRRDCRFLPGKRRQDIEFEHLSAKERTQLHEVLERVILAVCDILLPGCGGDLYRSFREEKCQNALLLGAVVDGIRAAKNGSIEGKTLRPLICSSFCASDVRTFLNEISLNDDQFVVDTIPPSIPKSEIVDEAVSPSQHEAILSRTVINKGEFTCHVVGCIIDQDGEVGTATGHTCNSCNVPVHSICCRRILKISVVDSSDSLYCSSCVENSVEVTVSPRRIGPGSPGNMVQNVNPTEHANTGEETTVVASEDMNDSANTSVRVSNARRSGSFGRMYQASRKNWDFLLCNGVVFTPLNTKIRRHDDDIRDALRFIFNPQNVQLLSWGFKRVRVDRQWITLPAIMHRKTTEHIFREYETFMQKEGSSCLEEKKPICRSSFLQICDSVTRGMQKRKSAVDYVLGSLVYDNLRVAGRIVKGELYESDRHDMYLNQIDAVEEFIKFTYLKHIGTDNDAIHDPEQALSQPKIGENVLQKRSECDTCMKPLQIIENIAVDIPSEREDVKLVLADIQEKIILYYGHQHRCFNQEKRIAALFEELRQDKATERAVVLLDYKMKFEPIRYREKTTEFFGKKGISWHGAAIFFYGRLPPSGARRRSQTAEDIERFDIQTLFLDHIVSNNMNQDVYAVCCLLDAVLARIKLELPTLQRIYLLSDNATCYQNDLLPVMAPFLAKQHELFLKGFVHSETQRGKSLLDAHFALAMMHINRFCNESRKDVTTPGDIVEALNSCGGVANCTAELVHIDRTNPNMEEWMQAHKGNKLSRLGRVNEIAYSDWKGEELDATCFKLSYHEGVNYTVGFCSVKRVTGPTESNENDEESLPQNEDQEEGEDITRNNITSRLHEYSYRSVITGVSVYTRARIRRQRRKRKLHSKGLPGTMVISETTQDLLAEAETNELTEESRDCSETVMLQCPKCDRLYRRENDFERHVAGCSNSKSNTVKDRACRIALEMIGTSDAPVYTTETLHPATLDTEISDVTRARFTFGKGWAKRPAYGHTLGTNYVENFAGQLQTLFDAGQLDKGRKMSASRMRELLEKDYPNRYDIPTEHAITSFISGLVRRHKKAIQRQIRGETDNIRRRIRFPADVASKLTELLNTNPSVMPKDAWKLLLESMGIAEGNLPSGFPSEASVKAKLSNLKTKMRQLSAT